MSETTTTAAPASVAALTVQDVISPRAFGGDVLSLALKAKAECASKQLVEFAGRVLGSAQAKNTHLAQQEIELEAALKAVRAEKAKITAAAEHAQATNNVFALAAAVGQKGQAIAFAQSAGLLVPANDDAVWSVPKAE